MFTEPSVFINPDDHGLSRLGEVDSWEVVSRNRIGRVGVVHWNRPLIFPVNHVVDGHTIVFRTGRGTKLTSAALGRPVVFEVDEYDEHHRRGVSVMVHGWLHEVIDPDDLARIGQLPFRPLVDRPRDHVLRIHSTRITGRAIGVADATADEAALGTFGPVDR